MNVLLIEDEPDYIERVKDGGLTGDISIISPSDVKLHEPFDENSAIEDQLLARFNAICVDRSIDIVLLDSDLSRIHTGITQSACREVFQTLGVPVCRYSKKHSATPSRDLLNLSTQAREGSSAVLVKTSIAQNPESQLLPWLKAVYEGFAQIRQALENGTLSQGARRGPAGILAGILGAPSSTADFQGYTAQNLFFFGGHSGSDNSAATPQQLSTRLGYWLLNYILQFPGPILTRPAAAAFLNLTLESFDKEPIQRLIASTKYDGPFAKTQELYWRDLIGKIIDEADGDIANHKSLVGQNLQRVDADNPGSSAFVCVLTHKPISERNAAPAPDWIPAGAQLARIETSIFDQLGPLLNI